MPEEMGGIAVAESTGAETGAESVETQVQTAEVGAESSNEFDSPQEKEGLTQKTPAAGKKTLNDLAKTHKDALKAIDPSLPGQIKDVIFENQRWKSAFPEGLKEAVATRDAISALGGVQGLQDTQQALQDYGNLESLFENGDPKFMSQLAEAAPEAFSQIMPSGLEKWRAIDPELYSHTMSRALIETLDQAKVSDTIEAIWNNLDPEKQKAERSALAQIWQTLNSMRESAAKAPERTISPEQEALSRREQEIAAREQRAMLAPVANAGKQQIQTIVEREMNSAFQWSATDPDVKDAIQDRVRQEVVRASLKDKNFLAAYDSYKSRGDAQGLQRHITNFQAKVAPGIVQRVARLFNVKPKGAPSVSRKTTAQASTTAERGWEKIQRQPEVRDIDRSKTTPDMVIDGKAILKSGRKVMWS